MRAFRSLGLARGIGVTIPLLRIAPRVQYRHFSGASDPTSGLTDIQKEFLTLAKDFSTNEILPQVSKWDEEQIFPVETLQKLGELGFGALDSSADAGGSGMSSLDSAIIFETLATGCISSAVFLIQQNLIARTLDRFASEPQKSLIPDLSGVQKFGAVCLPGTNNKLRVEQRGSDWVLNGTQTISSAEDIDTILVFASGNSGAELSCFVVDSSVPGISFLPKLPTLGWNSLHTRQVHFSEVIVPKDSFIGAPGQANHIAQQSLNSFRVNLAACSIGGAQACLELAQEHMLARKQFGKPLASFQYLQFKMADMASNLTAARQVVRSAAQSLDAEDVPLEEQTQSSSMAKVLGTEVGFQVCNDALQLFGGYGYLKDYQPQRYLRDLRYHQITAGTNESIRLSIANKLLSQN